MNYATRYRCDVCSAEKFLPERPLNPEPSIRTGCENCETLRIFKPV